MPVHATQVRNFTFSPDTGRITRLNYDTFGLPSIPEALLNVYEVEIEAVLEVRSGLVVLKRGAERAVILVSSGLLGYALDRAKVSKHWKPLGRLLTHAGTFVILQPATEGLALLQSRALVIIKACAFDRCEEAKHTFTSVSTLTAGRV
jgi:hypothetical protein